MADDRRHPVGARLAGRPWFDELVSTSTVGTVLVVDEAEQLGRGRPDLSVRLRSVLADARRRNTYWITGTVDGLEQDAPLNVDVDELDPQG